MVKRIDCLQFSINRASIHFEVTRYSAWGQRTNVQSTYLNLTAILQITHQATGITRPPREVGKRAPSSYSMPKDQQSYLHTEKTRMEATYTNTSNKSRIYTTNQTRKEGNRLEETYKSTKLCVEPRFPSAPAWSGTDLTNFPPSPPPDAADPGLRQAEPILST